MPGVIQQQEAAECAEEAPLWWRVLQETAQQAHSCEAELGELVQGLGGLLVSLVKACSKWGDSTLCEGRERARHHIPLTEIQIGICARLCPPGVMHRVTPF